MEYLFFCVVAVLFFLKFNGSRKVTTNPKIETTNSHFGFELTDWINPANELAKKRIRAENLEREALHAELSISIKKMRHQFAEKAIAYDQSSGEKVTDYHKSVPSKNGVISNQKPKRQDSGKKLFLKEWQKHLRWLDMLHGKKTIDRLLYDLGYHRNCL